VTEKYSLLNRLTDESEFSAIPILGLPVIEIAGDSRILIENHFGVKEYENNKIVVKVKYGFIDICGDCLKMKKMTKEQLIISGKIDCVSLIRRYKK